MNQPATVSEQFDVVVVGAGFSGLYMLYWLRRLGIDRAARNTAAGQVPGERLNLNRSLPPRQLAPAVIALSDQEALRVLARPRGENVHDGRR